MEKIGDKSNITPIFLNGPDEKNVKIAQGVKGINEDILQTHFITLIVGKPGCGKSHLIREYILNPDLYFQKFSYVIFVTPSRFEDPRLILDSSNFIQHLDLEWLHKVLRSYKLSVEEKDKNHKPKNILIILDDVISQLKKHESNPLLTPLFYNRRHLLGEKFIISYLITTQKYVLTPTKIRSVLTSVIVFPLMKMDWTKLQEECIYDNLDKRWINKFMNDIKEKKFTFLYIRLDNSKCFYKFEKCINY